MAVEPLPEWASRQLPPPIDIPAVVELGDAVADIERALSALRDAPTIETVAMLGAATAQAVSTVAKLVAPVLALVERQQRDLDEIKRRVLL